MVGDRELQVDDDDVTLDLLESLRQHREEHRPRSNPLLVWDPPSGEDTQVRED